MTNIIVLLVALWVAFQLPKWATKVVPARMGKTALPSALALIIKLAIAFLFAHVGWRGLADSMEKGLETVRLLGALKEVTSVIVLPEVLMAGIAILLSLWVLHLLFSHLKEPQDLTNSAIALSLILCVILFNNVIWRLLSDYITANLEGARLVVETEPFQVIRTWLGGLR